MSAGADDGGGTCVERGLGREPETGEPVHRRGDSLGERDRTAARGAWQCGALGFDPLDDRVEVRGLESGVDQVVCRRDERRPAVGEVAEDRREVPQASRLPR